MRFIKISGQHIQFKITEHACQRYIKRVNQQITESVAANRIAEQIQNNKRQNTIGGHTYYWFDENNVSGCIVCKIIKNRNKKNFKKRRIVTTILDGKTKIRPRI